MQGRQFLEVARELLPGTLPRHRRLASLDAINADPARRVAAIAALPP
jgi:hypothetical protein